MTACGGADTPVGETTLYKAAATFDLANNQAASLSSVLQSINGASPAITGAGCDGSVDQPVYLSVWVGDYAALGLYTNYSTDVARVAVMDSRQQLFYATTGQYQTMLGNVSSVDVAGDQSLDIPFGTTEAWYEFYCSTGTLSAGKVAL